MDTRRSFTLGRIIPVIIGIALVSDVAAHALPAEWFAFRAWEAAFRYPFSDGVLTPNLHYLNDRSFGDLPALANQPAWRNYRREEFTTDDFGFRKNPADQSDEAYDAVLLGDSFALGSHLKDNETLTAQLEQLSGRRIYNAGDMKNDRRRLFQLLDRLQMKKGIVFYNYMERHIPLSPDDLAVRPIKPQTTVRRLRKILDIAWEGFWKMCPLEILSQREYKKWQNDLVLPNPYAGKMVVDQLRNGEPILFLREDVQLFGQQQRGFDITSFTTLKATLAEHGCELRVILVPDKCTVYAPLLAIPRPDSTPLYLNRVEQALRQTGIPVLNLLPVFRQAAAERLADRHMLYFFDDTHWNAEGVRLAAETIQKVIPLSRDK